MSSVIDWFEERLARAATMPSAWYLDPARLALENEKIFSRTWQLVGRCEQVAAAGDFFASTVAGEPVLVARGGDGKLRSLSNVCRHRAGPVAAGAGRRKVFQCGYHGWTYSLDGRLLGTPEFEGVECFRREEHPLPEFRVDTWQGFVFVNLDPACGPLREFLGGLTEKLRDRGVEGLQLAARKDWRIDCNWKVYVDNYLEGYHIPIVHPSLNKELDYAQYRTETFRFFSVQHAPMRRGAPGRIRAESDSGNAQFFWIFPNLMLNVYPDNYSTNLIVPLGPDRTLTVFEWYFRDPEKPEAQEAVRQTVAFSDEIQKEDIAICEAVQRGLRSRTYERGRYSVARENGVHHFHSLLAEFLSRV